MQEGWYECEKRKQRVVDQWNRLICYCSARLSDPVPSVYDFMPLEGDPSPEEILALQKERVIKETNAAMIQRDNTLSVFKNYKHGRV